MKLRLLSAVVTATAIMATAGCTTSGPTFNLDSVTLANGSQAYRVQCSGLFENTNTCMSKIKEVCGDKTPLRISSVDHTLSGFKAEGDPREITFQCQTPQPPAPPPAPVAKTPPPPVPVPVVQKRTITLGADANFAFDKSELLPGGKNKLDSLIQDSAKVSIDSVVINGYTDSVGSKTYNERLSLRRAQTVRNYLQSNGLNVNRYEVHGYGAANPIASNSTADGRAQNRRVEIQLSGITQH